MPATDKNRGSVKEADPLLAKYSQLKQTIGFAEILFLMLLVVYLVFLYFQIMYALIVLVLTEFRKAHVLYEVLFLCSFALQRVPIIVLVMAIVFRNSAEGPTRRSKVYLFVGSILNIAGDIPLTLWSAILPGANL